jgi:hypothetical protein
VQYLCKIAKLPILSKKSSVILSAVLVLLALAGITLILWATKPYFIGVSPDSAKYISCARSLLEGNGYTIYNGNRYIFWPPLYPSLLAVLGLTGIEPLEGSRYINAFLFGLIIYSSGLLFMAGSRKSYLAIMGCICTLLSYPLTLVCSMAWSEPLFILLVVMFIIYLAKFLENVRLPILFIFSTVAAFACLQRHSGITLIMTACAVIIVFMKNRSLFQRLKYATISTVIAITPLAFWFLRNYIQTSTLTGGKAPSRFSAIENIKSTLYVVSEWFCSGAVSLKILFVLLMCTILVSFIALAKFWNTKKGSGTTTTLWCAAAFAVVYTFFIIVTSSIIAFDTIDHRILSPLYIPLLAILLAVIDKVLNTFGQNRSIANIVASVLFVAWFFFNPCQVTLTYISEMNKKGTGITSRRWVTSPLIEWLRKNPLEGHFYSNNPDALYILTDISARRSPVRSSYNSNRGTGVNGENLFKRYPALDGGLLVWFDSNPFKFHFTPDELKGMCHLVPINEFSDGIIYRIKRSKNTKSAIRDLNL